VIDEVFDAGARLIFMSSVEVFDGKTGNYDENAIPNPLNLYGRMKYEIEKHLAQAGGKGTIVRTGWNVPWDTNHRCVIKLTYETLLRPGAKMANDNTFSISDVRDTAEGLLRLADNDSVRVIHLASSPPVVRNRVADLVISFSINKDKMSYKQTSFSEISYSEPRAQYNHIDSSLAVAKLCMVFRPAEQIVREKVKLLDAVMEKAVVGV
jgi:dTDP-4-dehydrorhamnose reductase